MAYGKYEQIDEDCKKAYLEAITKGDFKVKSEGELMFEALDKNHLQHTAAKNILQGSGISITSLNNAVKDGAKVPTICLRKKCTKMNEDTKQEEKVTVGPIQFTEEEWTAFKYIVDKFFASADKDK